MNYRTGEDKQGYSDCNYNVIHLVEDISEESGPVTEPVTLSEMKQYLRLEGWGSDNEGIAAQDPIQLTLSQGELTVQSSSLINVRILLLTREGVGFFEADTPGTRSFSHDAQTGTITFDSTGATGGEQVDIIYGSFIDNASADAFEYDDDLIGDLITEGRVWVESYTNLHLVPKSLQVHFHNGAGLLQLPGPVTGNISIYDENGNTQSNVSIIGNEFPKIVTTFGSMLKAEYSAGYSIATCPSGLKNAIMAYVAENYENRGDDPEVKAVTERAARKARPYRKVKLFA